MKESEIRKPDYDYRVNELLAFFDESRSEIEQLIAKLPEEKRINRATLVVYSKQIDAIVSQLNERGLVWAETAMTEAATEGVADALMSLNLATSHAEAIALATMGATNEKMLFALISDTQDDILGVTQNMSRQSKKLIRGVFTDELRAQRAKGNNSYAELKKLLNQSLARQKQQGIDITIIDNGGRRWKQRDYLDMLVQTKMMHAHKESTITRALEEGTQYGRITRHGAKDACSRWEGKIVKLDPDAPGDYPYYGDLPNREIFHPRCKHRVLPVHILDED